MALFATSIIGMEITSTSLSAAVLLRQPALPTLTGGAVCHLAPGTLQINHREPNVLLNGLFADQLQQLRNRLQTRETRVALSLPDAVGRVLLLNLEGGWNSHADALEMIRWKIKKVTPLDPTDLQLDFQPLAPLQDGRCPVLVATIRRPILEQYEELLIQTGLQPAWVDFTGLSLVRAFGQTIATGQTVAFVSWRDNTLGTIFFHAGVPVFYRLKQIPPEQADHARVTAECTYALLAYQKEHPGSSFSKVLYLTQSPDDKTLRGLLASSFEQPLQLLEPSALCSCGAADLPGMPMLTALSGAIAAAAGRLPCA